MSDVRLAEIQISFSPPLRYLDKIPGMRPDRGSFVYRIRRDGQVHMSGSCQGSAIGQGGAARALYRAVEVALGAGYTHYSIRGEEPIHGDLRSQAAAQATPRPLRAGQA